MELEFKDVEIEIGEFRKEKKKMILRVLKIIFDFYVFIYLFFNFVL